MQMQHLKLETSLDTQNSITAPKPL